MYLIEQLEGLRLYGVMDRGIPNHERVVLQNTIPINLANFALLIGYRVTNLGGATPLPDQFFWLGEVELVVPTWIHVYTGSGTTAFSRLERSDEPVVALHWAKEHTVFNVPELVPVLVRFGSITVDTDQLRLGQIA